jgi:hypothetical protein
MITPPMPLSDPPDDGGYHAVLDFHKLHLSRGCPKTPLPGGGVPFPNPPRVAISDVPAGTELENRRYDTQIKSRFTLPARDRVQMVDPWEICAPIRICRRFGDLLGRAHW